MHATIGRYEGIDSSRTEELTRKVGETLVPKLSEIPGFAAYYLVEGGNGTIRSFAIFDSPAHAEESTRVAASWVAEQKLEAVLPNAPKMTSGRILASENGVLATA